MLGLQCCGSGMFIQDPGSKILPSRIRIKEFKYFIPKKWFLSSCNMIQVVHPGSGSPILTFYPSRIPDPGVKKHSIWIPDPDPQNCRFASGTCLIVRSTSAQATLTCTDCYNRQNKRENRPDQIGLLQKDVPFATFGNLRKLRLGRTYYRLILSRKRSRFCKSKFLLK